MEDDILYLRISQLLHLTVGNVDQGEVGENGEANENYWEGETQPTVPAHLAVDGAQLQRPYQIHSQVGNTKVGDVEHMPLGKGNCAEEYKVNQHQGDGE